MNWFIILIGFLGADTEPSYALIMDTWNPSTNMSQCARHAEAMHPDFVAARTVNFPDLEAHWVCAYDQTPAVGPGWRTLWIGYKGSNDWASTALIESERFMSYSQCFRDTLVANPPTRGKYTWEFLCVEPISEASY
jgi:hypothetical protein